MNKFKQQIRLWSVCVFALSLTACKTTPEKNVSTAGAPATMQDRVAELQVVDCLLPGQMRMVGNRSYLTPRRPTKTTAADCSIRGGEFVAYDRSNYKTALNVWMPEAESGDPEAQANVGEIFERGLGGEPNYEAARIWYTKAAEQGNKRAQFNLGTLYEQGLGVEKNMVIALNWYRQAWGVPSNDLVFQSVADKESDKLREQLNKQLARKNRQISILEKQIASLQSEVSGNAELKEEINELNAMVADLKREQGEVQSKRENLLAMVGPSTEKARLRQPGSVALATAPIIAKQVAERDLDMPDQAATITQGERQFGRYFALIIGNEDYQNIERLETPRNDVNRVAEVLESKYGFTVTRLEDSDNLAIMDAINNLNEVLTENDNLLIYYAGHGSRMQTGDYESGYWLPVNADPPPRDSLWIPNEFITRHLARLQAKRVMVIADSCYAGLLSNAPGYLMMENSAQVSDSYLQYKMPRKSRLLLTSGGDFPVLDSGGGNNSVFANALLSFLESNNRLVTAPEVFQHVRERVKQEAKLANFEQTPVYKVIKGAGHEMGDFFFVPVKGIGNS